jgi:ligand-binding sensor domain-containing protein
VHIHRGQTDVFSQSDGLTGDFVLNFFEDRESSIWAATTNGLDHFHELPVVTYSTSQGLSNVPSGAVLAARDGSVWVGTRDGLDRLKNGEVTVYRQRSAAARAGVREIAGRGLPDHGLASLFEDSRGRIWVSTLTGIGYLEEDRFVSTAVPGRNVQALVEDATGNLWSADQDLGLIKLSAANETQQIPWTTLGHNGPAQRLVPDPSQGGLWLGFYRGGIAWFRDSQVRASYSTLDGLTEGGVNHLRFDAEGALWAATDGGLSRLKDGRIVTLTSNNGLPCDAVHWTIEDDAQSVWLNMPYGLVRVARAELEAAVGKANGTIHTVVFDSSEGVRNFSLAGGYSPRVSKSQDGKLGS